MKKCVKTILSLSLALMLLTANAFAAEPSFTYKGKGLFSFQSTSEYTESDLFGGFKNVMPGDTLSETITFKNEDTGSDHVDLYLSARLHDDENGLTYSESYENADGKDQADVDGERDETVATMRDFLSQLTMTVKQGDKVIYQATPDVGLFIDDNFVYLGEIASGKSTSLTVELAVPITMGNDYAYRVGEVDWVFQVRPGYDDDDPDPSPKPSVTPSPSPSPSTTPSETPEPTPTPVGPDVPGPSGPQDITVKKVWKSGKDEAVPAAVVVTLFDGESAIESVRLDAANDWTYTWKGLTLSGDWQVKETILPKGYTPSYSVSGGVVTVTNTSTLIQTGQLNWPILALGAAGLLLIAVGGAMLRKKKSGNA